jgi:hypothetical protein|tara:strand:+ start:184 stop:501 length:318 start_codon:yes stop_codon:yes gene_type:complete
MSNVIKLRPDLKTFTIKVFYDHDFMEVEKIELQKRKFGRLSGLAKADLLQDVIHFLDQERGDDFDGYIKDVQKSIAKRKKAVAKKRKKAPKSPSAKVIRFRCKNK